MPDTVLVTGYQGGLGSGVVDVLEEAGWTVAGLDREQADLLDAADAERAIAEIDDLAAVAHLVGGFDSGPKVHETEPADFARMLDLNVKTTFNVARAAVPRLLERGGGGFVAVSAQAVDRPFPGAAGYLTAKAAVLEFVRALNADYGKEGLRANAILPSVIDTPGNRASMPDAKHDTWVAPSEIAAVIRFLCSDASAPTSGAHLPVYGRA